MRAIAIACDSDAYACIRALDSQRDAGSIVRTLLDMGVRRVVQRDSCVVRVQDLQEVGLERIFCGFDDVDIFVNKLGALGNRERGPITSDAITFETGMPSAARRAFDNQALLAMLGDGLGLNYATRSQEILSIIMNLP